uniref:Uncharacterized protein n=1 Tax=Arundo donax TaxID=35708 RepID=A0A0A9EDS3_ARUDO
MDALQGEIDELDIYRYFVSYFQLTLSQFLDLLPKLFLVALSHIPIFLLFYVQKPWLKCCVVLF